MKELRRAQFPRLRSAPPKQPLLPSIESLLKRTGLAISSEAVIEWANTIEGDLLTGYRRLLAIDQEIGGVGLYNVNRRDEEYFTGNYRIEFRPLFRPIQYVFTWVTDDDPVWNARRIVQDSCLHVEKAIKFRFTIPIDENTSLGVLLRRRSVIKELKPPFLGLLRRLNRVVYRTAKHSVEDLRIDAHRFTPADALAVYLICRWAGVVLLEPTGSFNDWKRPD